MTVMDERPNKSRVVVGVDGSPSSQAAIAWALEDARLRHAGVEVVYSWQLPSLAYSAAGFVAPSHDEIEAEGHAILDKALGELPATTDVPVQLRVCEGAPAETLREVAAEPDVSLVVVGSHGHGAVMELLLGSVSHALTHHCTTPLVIIHQPAEGRPAPTRERWIVVGVNGSPEGDTALQWAAKEARMRGAKLRVVVAWSESKAVFPTKFPLGGPLGVSLHTAAQDVADRAVDRLDAPDLHIERTVVQGRPTAVLTEMACSAELLVVGRRGLGHTHEVLHGSVSHACAHRSPVAVAVIPHIT
jgi:nucleotide-binding universal stress UspA family protein